MTTRIKKYLNSNISRWYALAKADYGVNGRFVDVIFEGNTLKILWEEEGELYFTYIDWFMDFTLNDLYEIWMESDWEKVA